MVTFTTGHCPEGFQQDEQLVEGQSTYYQGVEDREDKLNVAEDSTDGGVILEKCSASVECNHPWEHREKSVEDVRHRQVLDQDQGELV